MPGWVKIFWAADDARFVDKPIRLLQRIVQLKKMNWLTVGSKIVLALVTETSEIKATTASIVMSLKTMKVRAGETESDQGNAQETGMFGLSREDVNV